MRISALPAAVVFVVRTDDGLDPVTVVLTQWVTRGHGAPMVGGKIIVEVFGDAWSASFGNVGDEGASFAKFLRGCDVPYLVGKLLNSSSRQWRSKGSRKMDEAYVGRIVEAVQAALPTVATL